MYFDWADTLPQKFTLSSLRSQFRRRGTLVSVSQNVFNIGYRLNNNSSQRLFTDNDDT